MQQFFSKSLLLNLQKTLQFAIDSSMFFYFKGRKICDNQLPSEKTHDSHDSLLPQRLISAIFNIFSLLFSCKE